MKTSFYNRTGYLLPNMPALPKCFEELDDYFDARFKTAGALTHPSVVLAENLCRRMADAELYAKQICEAQKGVNTFRAAIFIGSLLVGYFTSCKSLLDAGAITLATLYNLTLTNKEMDFSRPRLLKQLKQETGPVVHGRYSSFQDLFDEIIKWRNSAVHRITPFVVTHSPGPPDKVSREKIEIKMVAKPDVGISTIVISPKSVQWVEPLHFHRKWQNQLINFCKEVCLDIRSQTL